MDIEETKAEILRRAKPIWDKFIKDCPNSENSKVMQYFINLQEALNQEIRLLILSYKSEKNYSTSLFEIEPLLNDVMYKVNFYLSIGLNEKIVTNI